MGKGERERVINHLEVAFAKSSVAIMVDSIVNNFIFKTQLFSLLLRGG